jgi:hypothetical protein
VGKSLREIAENFQMLDQSKVLIDAIIVAKPALPAYSSVEAGFRSLPKLTFFEKLQAKPNSRPCSLWPLFG